MRIGLIVWSEEGATTYRPSTEPQTIELPLPDVWPESA
jgi:hypothetical protein